jgi:DNA-binding response OmpR family regulator
MMIFVFFITVPPSLNTILQWECSSSIIQVFLSRSLSPSRKGESFCGLYSGASLNDKARLQETMKAITDAYDMLRLQWSALGKSPDHGVALLAEMKSRCPDVPFVFYSRKITPEDVICVLRAGAADAIRKSALSDEKVLARLAAAEELHRGEDTQSIRARGFNVNATIVPGE